MHLRMYISISQKVYLPFILKFSIWGFKQALTLPNSICVRSKSGACSFVVVSGSCLPYLFFPKLFCYILFHIIMSRPFIANYTIWVFLFIKSPQNALNCLHLLLSTFGGCLFHWLSYHISLFLFCNCRSSMFIYASESLKNYSKLCLSLI